MDDRKLTTLLAAVEHGSLSKAAASLGLTQAGVTQMMKSGGRTGLHSTGPHL